MEDSQVGRFILERGLISREVIMNLKYSLYDNVHMRLQLIPKRRPPSIYLDVYDMLEKEEYVRDL